MTDLQRDELTTDFAPIHEDGAESHPAYASFVRAMRGREYGYEALTTAWSWYSKGFADALPAATEADRG